MIQIMFARRLRSFLNNRTRVNCATFHSSNYFRRVNLTIAYHQTKHNLIDLRKNALLPVRTVQSYSNLPINEENDLDDEHSDVLDNNDINRMTENGYMYNLLQNSEKYNKTVVPLVIPEKDIPNNVVDEILAKTYEEYDVTEVINDFKTLSCHARLNSIKPSDTLHSKLFAPLVKHIPDLMDDQLWDLMKYAEMWFPMNLRTKPKSFDDLTCAIDNSLCQRIHDFSVDEILMTCDLTYHLRQPRYSRFFSRAMKKIGSKPGKLSSASYVHYMFLFNVARKTNINMYELEYALESIIDQLEANELGIIALAFFKTRTPIRNPALLDKIIRRCIVDMKTMGEIAISAVFKVVRYSIGLKAIDTFRELLRAFAMRIPTLSPPCLVHAGHAAATILVYEKDILDEIVDRFKTSLHSARIKDLERMLFILTIFNYPKESQHYELILNELRNPDRTAELQKYYKCLSSSLMYLSYAGIYPLDIISKVMDPDYLRNVYKNNSYRIGLEYLFFETSLLIEVPQYKGPTLSPRIRGYLSKKYSTDIISAETSEVRVQSFQKFMFEVTNYITEILGPDKFVFQQSLPHYQRPDLVLCVDSENNFISPQQFLPDLPVGAIKYAPKVPEGYKWLSLAFASHNHIFRGTLHSCGTFNAKLRQLEKLGYTPIALLHHTWQQFKKSDDKKQYLHDVILQNYVNNEIK